MVHITQSPVHARIWLRDQRPGSLRQRHELPQDAFGMLKNKEVCLYGAQCRVLEERNQLM
jgi:hypothetical protein